MPCICFLCNGETFPLAAQELCPRGLGCNEIQSRVSLLGYLCVLSIKLAPPPPKINVKNWKVNSRGSSDEWAFCSKSSVTQNGETCREKSLMKQGCCECSGGKAK